MDKTIATRLQVLLAKIAGEDIDLSGMTPDVAASPEERLMLDIADRIDKLENGGALPDVDEEDEGKVLTVNSSGEWDAETSSAQPDPATTSTAGVVKMGHSIPCERIMYLEDPRVEPVSASEYNSLLCLVNAMKDAMINAGILDKADPFSESWEYITPSYIEIDDSPTKYTYNVGDQIDYSGMSLISWGYNGAMTQISAEDFAAAMAAGNVEFSIPNGTVITEDMVDAYDQVVFTVTFTFVVPEGEEDNPQYAEYPVSLSTKGCVEINAE